MKRNLPVATLTNKKHILDEAGYANNFERMMYLNRHAKTGLQRRVNARAH
jgi:hypothetical protein